MEKRVRRPESKGQMVSHLYHYTLAHVYGNTHRYLNTNTFYFVQSYFLVAENKRWNFTLPCVSQSDLNDGGRNQLSQETWKGQRMSQAVVYDHVRLERTLPHTNVNHLPSYKAGQEVTLVDHKHWHAKKNGLCFVIELLWGKVTT